MQLTEQANGLDGGGSGREEGACKRKNNRRELLEARLGSRPLWGREQEVRALFGLYEIWTDHQTPTWQCPTSQCGIPGDPAR